MTTEIIDVVPETIVEDRVGTVSADEIADIIRGAGYAKVTFADLNKQFGIDLMNVRLDSQQRPKKAIHAITLWAYLASIVAIPCSFAAVTGVMAVSTFSTSIAIFAVSALVFATAIVILKSYRFATSHLYEYLTEGIRYKNAVCVVESYDKTTIDIPYGARLRYDEAVASKQFTDFMVCYPNMEELTDPAIVGLDADGDMHLIALWDKVNGNELEFTA